MSYIDYTPGTLGAEDAEDTLQPKELLESKIVAIDNRLANLPNEAKEVEISELLIEKAYLQLDLEEKDDAWWSGHKAFNTCIAVEYWEGAVQACDVMFLAEQPASLVALGNGAWLAVTFPINPELTVRMLEHIIDETPPESDGAAIAATIAHYIVDLRTEGKKREDLLFFTNQLLAKVARRHSDVQTQEEFEAWFKKLELDSPPDFLGRLAQILNVMVQDDWWVDRDALRAKLPQ